MLKNKTTKELAISALIPLIQKRYPVSPQKTWFRNTFKIGDYYIKYNLAHDSRGPRFIEVWKWVDKTEVRLNPPSTKIVSQGNRTLIYRYYKPRAKVSFTVQPK